MAIENNRIYTFVNEVLAGRAYLSDIDDWIEKWHESPVDCSLNEYLGLSKAEYQTWMKWGTFPDWLVAKIHPE